MYGPDLPPEYNPAFRRSDRYLTSRAQSKNAPRSKSRASDGLKRKGSPLALRFLPKALQFLAEQMENAQREHFNERISTQPKEV
jgi:hypothetical protein